MTDYIDKHYLSIFSSNIKWILNLPFGNLESMANIIVKLYDQTPLLKFSPNILENKRVLSFDLIRV